ncbi:MAG TPA: hypothetical protein VEJ36_08200 [Nitrososphaerales archaeon]|nr:hypothetical protein [Nitrososphaerales archaeon]
MKTIQTILSAFVVLTLALSPLVVHAAGIVTFTSPTAGSTISGSYSVAGTVSPAPTGADNLFIDVTNPAGNPVSVADVPVTPNTGAFSTSFTTGSGSTWPTGTYTITATDSNGNTGSTTFNFVAPKTPTTSTGIVLQVTATASTPVQPGDTVELSALVAFSNGTAARSANFTIWQISPSGSTTQLTATPTAPSGTTGVWWWSISVPSSAADGLNALIIGATAGSGSGAYTAWTQTGFTVDSSFASSASVASLSGSLNKSVGNIQTSLGTVTSDLGTIQTDLGTLSGSVSALQSSVTALNGTLGKVQSSLASAIAGVQNSITSLSSAVGTASSNAQTAATNAQNAATSAKDAQNAVSSTQTYVLVVAVLAAITLVLELAILVRKLS